VKIVTMFAAASMALASTSFAASPAQLAEPVKDKATVVLDPNSSYILLQISFSSGAFAIPVSLIRKPTEADIADYRQRRCAALAKAHAKWVKAHASWAEEAAASRGAEPIEPTDATLDFTPIEVETMITIGPFNRFAKNKTTDRSVYLTRVQPGRYAIYGPVNIGVNGVAAGTCACMGTLEFDVAPGQIVDAGTLRLNLFERMMGRVSGPKPRDELDLPDGLTSVGWDLPANSGAVDPRLNAYRIVPAQLRPAGPFNNYFGVQIDRLTAIPGLLEYQRDRIIDPRQARVNAAR